MKAVILAGGFGTRMRPLTYTTPKPLLPLLNKPLIQHIIDTLPERVDEIIIAANYKIEKLKDYFDKIDDGRKYRVIDEPEPRGTAGAVKNVEEFLDGSFFVINSDIISSIDFNDFLQFYEKREGVGAISSWSVDDPTEFGVLDIDEDSRIKEFQEKPDKGEALSNNINAGHYILEPEVLDMIPEGRKVSIEHEIFPKLVHDGLFAYEFDGFWIDCGRPSSLLKASKILLDRKDQNIIRGKNSVVKAKTQGHITIGQGCNIQDCTIENSIIFDRVKIKKGCYIKDSILGFDVNIEDDALVKDSIIGDRNKIEKNSVLKDEKLKPEEETR